MTADFTRIAELLALLIALAMFAMAAVAIAVAFRAPDTLKKWEVAPGSIVRLTTILSIVIVLSLLCAAGKVQGDAVVGLLGAIAGYVLGAARSQRSQGESPDSN